MRCRKAKQLVSARKDGELDAARGVALRTHLEDCPACQQAADDWAGVSAALAVLETPEPRPGFTQRLIVRLPTRQIGRSVWSEWLEALRPAPLAADGLALAAGMLMAVWMNGEQRQPAPPPGDPTQTVYVESFDPLPDGSAAAKYLSIVTESGR
jgi:anti-sigma factor RsiW